VAIHTLAGVRIYHSP